MAYDNERIFAERLANVFLQDNKITVRDTVGTIAMCNVQTKQILFDFSQIFPENTDQEKIYQQMMVFKGLNFHEIMHLKFTPRKKNLSLPSQILNLLGHLEDGRIETLGVMLHEKLADYFISAVNEILLKDKKAIVENKDNWLIFAYILCYGRSIYFQDKELLALMRNLIIKTYGRDTAEMIENSINQFLPEKDFEKRIDIATKLNEFLFKKQGLPKFNLSMPTSVFIDTKKDENERSTDSDLKDLAKDFPELAKALENVSKKLSEMTKGTKDGSKDLEKAKAKKEKKINDLMGKRKIAYDKMYEEKEEKTRNKLRDIITKLTQEIYKQDGKGYTPDGVGDMQKQLKDMIQDKETEQEKMVEMHKEDLIADLKSIGHELQEVFSDNSFTVTNEMKDLAKELEKSLAKMNNELARGYQPKNKSGRLNVRSLLNRKSQIDFKIFNRYTPDKLKLTKALVNIYLDGSGSMSGNWDKAVRTMWIINEALNRDENKVMIYQFSSDYELIKEYDKPLTVPRMIGGGTYPASAINNSIPIIEGYRKAKNFNFVVDIIITDGVFDNVNNDNDNAIMKLNSLGHETILINVHTTYNTHNTKHNLFLFGFGELVESLSKIFIEIKKGLIAKAKVN